MNIRPDMVIPYVILPKGNGMKSCNALNRNIKTPHLPVMVMLANNHLNAVKVSERPEILLINCLNCMMLPAGLSSSWQLSLVQIYR
ncbi:hypothetical protein [Pedobacter sp. KLB.chiD]|uniref:hypothetical protein n=1 Tax=Pedobacter sp. KLB.chiD TaxID=3387402 RepID=UPI00399B9326